ncbi:uncharacterized protein PV09_05055 [Verruconis gallopava]|uniref:Major facilitator superfamily (MFS) profile domain-containing protein n=1 Tax=Verruconis gallopava TaxID=253628 RepID=A0A0D2AAF2_9PEZI|nr:uncharacterized protein PV09_05055 [Verruconis gallopava]KIW03748.1 hypothetical protein PV09_05055 [Verruconis gallopava]
MATMLVTDIYELRPTQQATLSTTSSRTSLHLAPCENNLDQNIGRQPNVTPAQNRSMLKTFLIVFQLCMINFLTSITNGLITVGLPTIASSTNLPRSLYLWPTSVYGLTSGATLLLAGAIADQIGARLVDLIGCVILSTFTLACSLSNTGVQLVVFRAFQGVGMSMHLPSSVSLIAAAVPQGKGRNFSYGCLGLSQPLGFSTGLVVGGIMIEKAGWRSGFYMSGGALVVATVVAFFLLPKPLPTPRAHDHRPVLIRLWAEIDWIGGIIASAGLALLSYVLALLSADLSIIHKASTGALLALSVILLLSFPAWMHFRQKKGNPALIPNNLWRKAAFTSTCIMIALAYGLQNAMELFSSLYFQEIQKTSLLLTSLRLLPNLLVGAAINFMVGMLVDRFSARRLVVISSLLSAGAPLMMAFVDPRWSYWNMEFWAQILAPMCGDVLFTVGLLIISSEFPEETQALAGAVFNTLAQFGMSLGVTLCQVVALAVSAKDSGQVLSSNRYGPDEERKSLLGGYRASFWSMFAFGATCALVAAGGLRKAGKVGVKRD